MPESNGAPPASAPPGSDADFLRVYAQLRELARQFISEQAPGHTLQATALVHEAWIRLLRSGQSTPAGPAHFHRLAATAMRHILIDHARAANRQKRAGRRQQIAMDAVELASEGHTDDILAVDAAIERVRERSPALAELVQLRFFAGLTVEEAARALGQSERSAYRDWNFAKALLLRELRAEEG